MVEVSYSLRSVFNATVKKQNDTFVLEVPEQEVSNDAITASKFHRLGIFEMSSTAGGTERVSQKSVRPPRTSQEPDLPIEDGEIRDVEIETRETGTVQFRQTCVCWTFSENEAGSFGC